MKKAFNRFLLIFITAFLMASVLLSFNVGLNVFFASTFCRKLQVKNTECCIMENP